MIGKKMEEAFNQQMQAEAYSSYLYLAMSAHFESANLKGIAHWLKVQAKEESEHAMKFYEHILERGGQVMLQTIDAPPAKWASPLKAFEEVVKHEESITAKINKLVDLAQKENDHASGVFLQWFVSEQVEEEANANEILGHLKMIGDSVGGLLALDHHLGKRE